MTNGFIGMVKKNKKKIGKRSLIIAGLGLGAYAITKLLNDNDEADMTDEFDDDYDDMDDYDEELDAEELED